MNAFMNGYNQYQSTQVTTASREQILIMLYDGAIRFVRQAQEGLAGGDRARKIEGIQKAMAIVTEFRNTLDHEVGGEISANLDALYDYMLRELVKANAKSDPKPLQVVEGLLCDLRETWAQAIEIARKEGQAATQAPPADYKPLNSSL